MSLLDLEKAEQNLLSLCEKNIMANVWTHERAAARNMKENTFKIDSHF